MATTSRTDDGDPFDSPLYWWSWLVMPVIAAGVAIARPSIEPPRLVIALVVPMMVATAWMGTVGHDDSDGVSFWPVAEVFLLIQALVTFAAASAAARLRRRAP